MKASSLLLLFVLASAGSFGQQKYFEGVMTHKVSVGSKVEGLDENYVHKLMATGDVITIYIKNGNYKHVGGLSDVYYRQKEKRVFYKFKYLDTLYYLDYSDDTSKVMEVVKSVALTRVNNEDCRSITIKTTQMINQWYYSSSFLNNPDYDRDNTIGHFDVYSRETGGAIWLMQRSELNFGWIRDSCVKVELKEVDDHVFDLPDLPQKKLGSSPLSFRPRFPGKGDAWLKYLQANLDSKLAIKYLKLPKGDSIASQQVMVKFMVLADGSLTDLQVVNKNEVHPKLAEEALRVIRESPRWIPGVIYGEKIKYPIQQPVSFAVMR